MAQRSLNKVMLMGHLGRDPEIRYTSSGRAMATFSLATSERWKDREGGEQERTEWHRVVVWGRMAEVCGQYLSKGRLVYVEGRIQSRDWEDQDGNRRTTYEIVANDMIMVGAGGPGKIESEEEDFRKEGPPRGQPSPQGKRRPEEAPYPPPPLEDDIPF